LLTNRHSDWSASVYTFDATHQTVGRVHCDGTNAVFTEVALHFEYQFGAIGAGDLKSVKNFRQAAVWTAEVNVHNGADNLFDTTDIGHSCELYLVSGAGFVASGDRKMDAPFKKPRKSTILLVKKAL
jgi:hypothetical protein